MIKFILILSAIVISSTGYGQRKSLDPATTEILMQKCLDLPVIENHLKRNEEVIYQNKPAIILKSPLDARISLHLYKYGKKAKFARLEDILFPYNYDFTKVVIKKRKAWLVFRYCPFFNTSAMKEKLTGFRYADIFFEVCISFRKKKGKWAIWRYKIKDLAFKSQQEQQFKWAQGKYIPLPESLKTKK